MFKDDLKPKKKSRITKAAFEPYLQCIAKKKASREIQIKTTF